MGKFVFIVLILFRIFDIVISSLLDVLNLDYLFGILYSQQENRCSRLRASTLFFICGFKV